MKGEANLKRVKELLKVYNYSNLSLALYKLHILNYLPGNEPDKGEYLREMLKRVDESSLKEALKLLKGKVETAKEGYQTESFKAKVGYKLILGMGNPSYLENGFLLHPVYGIPYIQGETLKGLARFLFLLKAFPDLMERPKNYEEKIKRLEEGKYEDERVQREYSLIFGDKSREGLITFFDAYPLELRADDLTIDVMNPHYWKYYENKGKELPGDWENPRPILFLALKNVEFSFGVGFDPLRIKVERGREILKKVINLLREGLTTFGLGAKRRKGYGWFYL